MTRIGLLQAVAAISLAAAVSTTASATVTLTGSELQGLTYQAPGPGATSAYVPLIGVALTNPNNVNNFSDTALVLVPNGYFGVSLGTLNSILTEGAAGNVSFDLVTGTDPNNNLAYWDVLLQNPGNVSQTIDVNAFGDNHLGANPFNLAGQQSVSASCDGNATGGVTTGCFFSTWSPAVTSLYGTWNVVDVSIGIGGQNDGPQTATIDSITLPGTLALPVPEPGSLAILGSGLLVIGFLGQRRTMRTRAGRSATRIAI